MENAPELTEEMLVQQLTGACEEQIKALWVTSRAHENLFGPLDAEREQESDTLLRLRKVHCHAIAATSCPVDEWAIHAMAPDIRAAFGQLKTLVSDGVCAEVHEPGERDCPMPRCFSTWDGLLAPFSHPTSVVLMFYSGAGGLRKDDVRCLSNSVRCCLAFRVATPQSSTWRRCVWVFRWRMVSPTQPSERILLNCWSQLTASSQLSEPSARRAQREGSPWPHT